MSKTYKFIIVIGLALLLNLIAINNKDAMAVSYDVDAKVPAEVPGVPAEITYPVSGDVFTVDSVMVSGNCPITSPAQVVMIWVNGTFAGSTSCVAGNYSISITLQPGQNTLVPKLINITNDLGPIGAPVVISYSPPVTPATPEQPQTPDAIAPQATSSQSAAQTDTESESPNTTSTLKFTAETEFLVFGANGEVSLVLNLEQGQSPYTVYINWGDGTQDTYTYDTAGRKIIKHIYASATSKQVFITVTDKTGKTLYLTLGAVSQNPNINISGDSEDVSTLESLSAVGWALLAVSSVAVAIAAVLILGRVAVLPTVAAGDTATRKTAAKLGVKRGKKS